jgi:ribosomal protein S27AE
MTADPIKDALRVRDPKKQRAVRLVRDAIQRGILVRPNSCEACGQTPPRGKDGRATIQAHHEDYDKPLSVRWVCCTCHYAVTPRPNIVAPKCFGAANGMNTRPDRRPRGEANGYSKLTEAAVLDILTKTRTIRQYAEAYSVSPKTIQSVLYEPRWLHLKERAAREEGR